MIFYRLVLPLYRRAGSKMADDCRDYVKSGSKFLDLGCGSGIISLDIVDNRIVPVNLRLFDGRSLPFGDGSFDFVLISYVLHHSDDPAALLAEAKRTLKAGGRLIIFEDLYQGQLAKVICEIHGGTYGVLFERGKGKGNRHFKTQAQWEKNFENLGLKLIYGKRVSSILTPVNKRLFVLEKR
jgi:ubiquinone/menaquinone biosynthesis C-methylase UbiE